MGKVRYFLMLTFMPCMHWVYDDTPVPSHNRRISAHIGQDEGIGVAGRLDRDTVTTQCPLWSVHSSLRGMVLGGSSHLVSGL